MSQDPATKARDTALQGALTQIERQFGKGTVMRMGDEGAQVRVEAIPTGALSLDLALGIGGMPRGRIVEVFGPESSGKTTLVYHVIAEAQKLGGVCAFIDAEHAMDPLYAQNLGVNIDELLVSQPDYGEQGLEIADMLVRSGAVDVVAIDSVAALTPRAELEGQMGDQTVGVRRAARITSGVSSRSRSSARLRPISHPFRPISRARIAFCQDCLKVRPIAMDSPTAFIWTPRVASAEPNFSKAKRGNFTTT